MSNERQILVQVQKFMNYHEPELSRQLPDTARVEYNFLRELIDKALEPVVRRPAPVVSKAPAKKKAKKVAKKK